MGPGIPAPWHVGVTSAPVPRRPRGRRLSSSCRGAGRRSTPPREQLWLLRTAWLCVSPTASAHSACGVTAHQQAGAIRNCGTRTAHCPRRWNDGGSASATGSTGEDLRFLGGELLLGKHALGLEFTQGLQLLEGVGGAG